MIKAKEVNDRYFEWMCGAIYDNVHERGKSYIRLFKYLHATEFKYFVANDSNRAQDGVNLRLRFARVTGCDEAEEYINGSCTVFEMMVALAIRIEEHIMDDPEKGDRTSQWFWIMVNNLELSTMTDDNFIPEYVEEHLTVFMNREYGPDGDGGALFKVENCTCDFRQMEIWYQMNGYLKELED